MQVELLQLERRFESLRLGGSPEVQARLLASLVQDGQQSPILVARDDACLVVIDGYARIRAAMRLGWDTLEAVALELPVGEALIVVHRMEAKRSRTALEEGWLIAELLTGQGMSARQIALRLHRSASWVCRRASLVIDLPDKVQKAVLDGRIPPRATARYLTVLARANTQHCERMVSALDRPITDRELKRLYLGWRRATGKKRARIVEQPILFLKADEAARAEPKLARGDPAEPLAKALVSIANLSRQAERRVRYGLLQELDERRLAVVRQAAASCQTAFNSLINSLSNEAPCSTTTPAPPS